MRAPLRIVAVTVMELREKSFIETCVSFYIKSTVDQKDASEKEIPRLSEDTRRQRIRSEELVWISVGIPFNPRHLVTFYENSRCN